MHFFNVPIRREPSPLYASEDEFAAVVERRLRQSGRLLLKTPEEHETYERDALEELEAIGQRERRRKRAQDAQRKKVRTKRSRENRPAPKPSRQYCGAMSTMVMRDERLVYGARTLAQIIYARIGRARAKVITKASLAKALGCCERTIQRHLSELRRLGYILTEAVFDRSGRQTGQRISVTDKLRAFWEQGKKVVKQGLEMACQGFHPRMRKAGETGKSSNKALYESMRGGYREKEEGRGESARYCPRERPG